MKKKILFNGLLLLTVLFSFTSCLNDDSNSSSDGQLFVDNVAVVSSLGSYYFVGSGGATYMPVTNSSTATISSLRSAFIQFSVLSSDTTAHRYNINLQYAGSTLSGLNSAATTAKLDSVKNDSVISFNAYCVVNDQYLVTSVNYYLSKKMHYMTLCNIEDKSFISSGSTSAPDTLRFYLRHNSNGDVASTTRSYDVCGTYPTLYYFSYDIADILTAAKMKNNGKNIYIDVVGRTQETVYETPVTTHSGFLFKW